MVLKKSDFLNNLAENQIIIIDNDIDLLNEIIDKNISAVLFIGNQAPDNEDVVFLQKPVSSTILLAKVRLLNARIEKAICLLKYNQTSITETAALCGFTSLHYFSRKFKEKTGAPPSAYLK